jgi:cell division protein FtsZ
MVFVTAGMGGGTGTGAAPVVARVAREMGILTVGVVTKPFQFEGGRRMRLAEGGIAELQKSVDTLIIIPNQNLFRVANERTTFADAFAMADQVLYSGVACITDLMVKEGLINLDFADVRSIMSEMGKAMMGTGEASGERRAVLAAEAAIANPLLDEVSMKGARGLLISITGGNDLTLYEVDEAASRIRQEVDEEANIILGATFDEGLNGVVRVSVVATGIDQATIEVHEPSASQVRIIEAQQRLRAQAASARSQAAPAPAPAPAPVEPVAILEEEPSATIASASDDEVEIRPAAVKPALHVAPPTPRIEEPVATEYFPPAPEQVIRPARMPQIEDLPPVVQQQMRVHRGEQLTQAAPAETRRRSLLEKLAAFGISRQEEAQQAAAPRAIAPSLPAPAPMPAPAPAPQRAAASSMHAEYGRPQPRVATPRPPQGSLDSHGRMGPRPAALEEDQLEIPAFLRRQSN